jgi:RNA polymerase primary sigma factor
VATKTASKIKLKAKHAAKKPAPAKAASAKAAAVKKAAPKKPEPKKPLKAAAKVVPLKGKVDAKAPAKLVALAGKKPGQPEPQKINGKIAGKPMLKGKPEDMPPGDADSPLLDMSDVGVRKMITRAKTRGYVTYDELNKVMPSEKVSSEQIEDTMSMLNEMGINVIESEEQEEGAEGEGGEGAVPATTTGTAVATTATGKETYDRTDDPVRMYLREMGSVELLSREGEIAIAKRIEAGRELMIGALCESPLTFEALTVWRDELNDGKVLLRDIIDLEAMYGAGPDGQPNVPPPVGPDGKPLQQPASIIAAINGTSVVNGQALPRPEYKKPEPPKPPPPRVVNADGEVDPGEAAAAADAADAEAENEDEGNLPLSAMEAALKPQVLETLDNIANLYKKLGKLQDASVEAALGADELSTSQERRFKKLRNETMDLVKSLKLMSIRCTASIAVSFRSKAACCALPKRMAWIAATS